MQNIPNNSMKNKARNLILTNLVGVHPMYIHTKNEANPLSD